MSITTLELQSLITPHGELRLTLEEVPVPVPGPDEMVVRVDAAPIYPSDVGDLLGPADLTTLNSSGPAGRPVTTAKVPSQLTSRVATRMGKSVSVGNEGAGVVVAAGKDAAHLIGKVVGALLALVLPADDIAVDEDVDVVDDVDDLLVLVQPATAAPTRVADANTATANIGIFVISPCPIRVVVPRSRDTLVGDRPGHTRRASR